MDNDNKNMRVVALYRASTKAQTDKDNNNDLPTQKKIVQEFIHSKGWDLIREFTEGGVSGFKISEKNRDALQTIKTMATNNMFDILVVYMSDRLGRIADETPLVVKYLNEHSVKVWSVSEGEIKAESHSDKLLLYLRYWMNEGESRKTQQRVSDYIIAAVEEGRYKGGNCIPLGYKLVDNGNKNFKGRKIKDFVINPDEVEIVKLIYYLSLKMNYGQRRIALYLNNNGYKTREGNAWKSASIQLILSNPIYKGQFKIHSKMYNKDVYSPIQEHLVIIPEIEWEENRKKVMERKYIKKDSDYENIKPIKNTHGKLLLSGLIYCGHCNEKLTTFLETKKYKKKNGEITTSQNYRYRCMSFYKRGAVKCDGQSAYGSKKIHDMAIDEIKNEILSLQGKNLKEDFLIQRKKELKDKEDFKKHKYLELETCYKEVKLLKEEVVKSLMGTSSFTPEILKELLNEKENNITKLNELILKIESDIIELNVDIGYYVKLDEELFEWDKKFDTANDDLKKAMIATVVEKITVFKDKVKILFNLRIRVYKENLLNLSVSNEQDCQYSYSLYTWTKEVKFAS